LNGKIEAVYVVNLSEPRYRDTAAIPLAGPVGGFHVTIPISNPFIEYDFEFIAGLYSVKGTYVSGNITAYKVRLPAPINYLKPPPMPEPQILPITLLTTTIAAILAYNTRRRSHHKH